MTIISQLRQWQIKRRRARVINSLPKRLLVDIGIEDFRSR